MDARVRVGDATGLTAPATLLGQNLELAGDTMAGLLSDRLENGRFLGPPVPGTGLAPGWQPAFTNNYAGIAFDLTEGLSHSGLWSQMLHNTSDRSHIGMLQTGRWVRSGEKLQVTLWAMCRSRPVSLCVGLRPLAARAPDYARATINVDRAYWSEYRVVLEVPSDDAQCVFYCTVEERGRVWIDQIQLAPEGNGLVRPDLVDEMRSLDVPVLRFPGGCVSTNYHWRLGTGARDLRPTLPDPVFKWTMRYEFGTDEYLALCEDMGIQPHITVNIGSGTPAEAHEWARYCADWYREQQLPLPTMYWQIGNEHYGAWELGNMTGAMYADALRAYVPGIRAAYSRARIIALGPETGEVLDPDERLPWRAPVLDGAADQVDLVAIQNYASAWDDDATVRMAQAIQGAASMEAQLRKAAEDCRRREPNMRVAVTEWNLWRQALHYDGLGFLEPYDAVHGLFVSSALHGFCRLQPGLELANFYHLLNPMGLFISRGAEIVRTSSADVFALYRPAFPGQLLAVGVETPDIVEGVGAIDALALRTADADWLYVSNRSPTQEALVAVQGIEPTATRLLHGEHPDRPLVEDAADMVGADLRLPPLSIARLGVLPR